MTHPFPFQNSYARLPDRFFARVAPTPVEAPRLIAVNAPLANRLGIDAEWLRSPEGVEVLSGRRVPGGAEPIATAYAGHQFGQFVPQLGDGRAVLLGEVVAPDGGRFDVQLKGAGPTPFSRRGDGRAALGPVLREYVLCEAMHALGIPTTRALAAVATGEWVFREEPLPGAVLTRVAASHLRVGTFQFFAARRDVEALRLLADHVIDRHYPEAAEADNRYLALLRGVTAAQADLVARWMLVGFIHGVMNTDNMSLAGETIDYGPCAFMDAYHPGKVFSSIDTGGRYAFANQPDIALWNLTRLAETLLPLLGMEQEAAVAAATEELKAFAGLFNARFHQGLGAKLSLTAAEEGDAALAFDLLDAMADNLADFTRTFRGLSRVVRDGDASVRDEFANPQAFDAWAGRWRERLLREPERAPAARAEAMDAVNPAFIPRNHRVEAMIEAAVESGDFGPFRELMTVLARPFDEQPEFSAYADAPAEGEQVTRTFCGT